MAIILAGFILVHYIAAVESGAVAGELYSSLTSMNDVFTFDKMVGTLLPHLPPYLLEVKGYRDLHSGASIDQSELGKGDILNVAITGNPLHIYSVIKRLVLYWPAIRRSITLISSKAFDCEDKHHSCEWWALWSECEKNPTYMLTYCQKSCGYCGNPELRNSLGHLRDLENRTVLPTENDLKGASLALARLQQVYRIPIPDMANGKIAGVSTSVRLTPYDCVRIANESHYQGEYANAYQWYNYAFAKVDDPEIKGFIGGLQSAVAVQHDEKHANNSPAFFPHHLSKFDLQPPWDSNYARLCRGSNFLTAEDTAKLKCHLSSRGSPYLILQPVKYEELHKDPEMYLFHDVVSSREIEAIKSTAKAQLQRSLTVGSQKPVEFRVSQTAWLRNDSHPFLPAIARRISAITGLFVCEGTFADMAGESLQVLSYGIGGHYSYHFDPFYKTKPEDEWENIGEKLHHYESGDRMATWMFYLSEVEAGGRTAFPRAGISVTPIEGSAVLWYNIKKNGFGNQKSEHGGCPVLLGHKWVANKWIRENWNFLRRPCSLDSDE